ncbi:MAG: AI-2E family transporter, partial [Deltaproteobacteria bacterium]
MSTPPEPEQLQPGEKQNGYHDFARRVLIAAAIVLSLVLLLALVFYTIRVLILIFIGILIAVFLRGLSDWVVSWSRLPPRLALTVVILSLATIASFLGLLLTPHISEQLNRLSQDLPRATQQVIDFAHRHLGLGGAQETGKLVGGFSGLFSKLGKFFSITVEALAD